MFEPFSHVSFVFVQKQTVSNGEQQKSESKRSITLRLRFLNGQVLGVHGERQIEEVLPLLESLPLCQMQLLIVPHRHPIRKEKYIVNHALGIAIGAWALGR